MKIPIPFEEDQPVTFKIPKIPITSYSMDEEGYTSYFRTICTLFESIKVPPTIPIDKFLKKQPYRDFTFSWMKMKKEMKLSSFACSFSCNHTMSPRMDSLLHRELTQFISENSYPSFTDFQVDRALCPLCRKLQFCPRPLVTEILSKFVPLYRSNKEESRLDCTPYMIKYEEKCYQFLYSEPPFTFDDYCNQISEVIRQCTNQC